MHLNRNRNFNTVHPPTNNAHFQQDGLYFDIEGLEIDVLTGKRKDTPEKAPQLIKKSPSPPVSEDDFEDAIDESPLDLDRWAAGEVKAVPWPTVVAAVQSKFGEAPRNKAHALELIAAGKK